MVPNPYKQTYANISNQMRIRGCTASKTNKQDNIIGNNPIISFNSFHLNANIAKLHWVYSL